MNHRPQYTYDGMGNKTGVFLTIEEYEQLSGISANLPVEQWEVDLIKKRMAEVKAAPRSGTPWEVIRQQMIDEDGPL